MNSEQVSVDVITRIGSSRKDLRVHIRSRRTSLKLLDYFSVWFLELACREMRTYATCPVAQGVSYAHLTACCEEGLEDSIWHRPKHEDHKFAAVGGCARRTRPDYELRYSDDLMPLCLSLDPGSLSIWFSALVYWPHSDGSDRAQVLVCLKSGEVTWSKLISGWTSHRLSCDQSEGWLMVRWSRKQGAVGRIQGDKNHKLFRREQ